MATKLLYLEDFDVVKCDAKVIETRSTGDGLTVVVLDQTCFYPRGGGQDWDEGTIMGDDAEFTVKEVRLDDQGVVQHLGTYTKGLLMPGDAVRCVVDTTRRSINTRLHSAGHLVDYAVDQLGLGWLPGRGAHYPHMSFVEYEGEVALEQLEDLRTRAETIANGIVRTGGENTIHFMPVSEMHTICRHVPTNIPSNKPARVVIYHGDFGVPCGGTHVRDLRNIGHLTITKIKVKKNLIKVSYAVEGINA